MKSLKTGAVLLKAPKLHQRRLAQYRDVLLISSMRDIVGKGELVTSVVSEQFLE